MILIKYKWVIIILSSLTLSACYDKDLVNIEETAYYHPEFSIPIGESEINMGLIVEDYWPDLFEVPDTLNLPDSLIFHYNDILYSSGVTTFISTVSEPVDLSFIDDKLEYVKSAMIRTNTINRIPATLNTQVYFLDSGNQVIDSLFHNGWSQIEAAEIDSVGNLIKAAEEWKNDVELSSELIQRLPEISYVQSIIKIELENYVTTNIHYIDKQDIWVQLAMRIKLDLPLHEI